MKDWALSASRVYLLTAHRTGEDVTEDRRALLRTELGAPEDPDGAPVIPPPRSKVP